jgi:Na+/proline symporter
VRTSTPPANPNTLTDYARRSGITVGMLADLVYEAATEKVTRRNRRANPDHQKNFETDIMWSAWETNARGYFAQIAYLCDFYTPADVRDMLANIAPNPRPARGGKQRDTAR